jgi:hypothetical protein
MAEEQSWTPKLIVAAIGILGALAGYLVQNFLSRERERSSAFEERQNHAYDALVDAFDKYRLSQEAEQAGDLERAGKLKTEYESELRLAARRVAVYGDKDVVRAMAEWHRAYWPEAPPPCDKLLGSELDMWVNMRAALLVGDQQADPRDLATITGPNLCTPTSGR